MKALSDHLVHFLQHEHFVIVSSFGEDGFPHGACKGIVKIDATKGHIYLLDLYKAATYENLRHNKHMSITTVNEHQFTGYCLKGKARIIKADKIKSHIIKAWEDKITTRITHRILRNMQQKGHPSHPEASMPKPAYLIVMEVEEIINLTPHAIK